MILSDCNALCFRRCVLLPLKEKEQAEVRQSPTYPSQALPENLEESSGDSLPAWARLEMQKTIPL